jgi:hypothetical protein
MFDKKVAQKAAPEKSGLSLSAPAFIPSVDLEKDGKDISANYELFNVSSGKDNREISKFSFYNPQFDESREVIRAVILHLKRSNRMTDFDNVSNKNLTLCISFDLVKGRAADPGKDDKATICEGCEFLATGDCGRVYSLFCYDLDKKRVFIIVLKKASVAAAKKFFTANFYGKAEGKKDFPYYAKSVKMTLDKVGSGSKTYAAINLQSEGWITPEIYEEIRSYLLPF